MSTNQNFENTYTANNNNNNNNTYTANNTANNINEANENISDAESRVSTESEVLKAKPLEYSANRSASKHVERPQ